MKKEKSGKVTLANVLAVIGLVLLLVFLWLGQSLRNGELGGMSAIISLLVTAGAALLLWMMIKAKSTDPSTSQWKAIEYGTLAVYLLLAVFTAPLALNFFSVVSNKAKLQATARKDLNNIDQEIREFKLQELKYAQKTADGLNNVWRGKSGGYEPNAPLARFIMEQTKVKTIAELDKDVVDVWLSDWEKAIDQVNLAKLSGASKDLDGVEPQKYGPVWEEKLKSSTQAVDNWQLLKIPVAISNIKSLSEEVGVTLTAFSKNTPFQSIKLDKGQYVLDKKSMKAKYHVSSQVQDEIKSLSPYTVLGIAAMVLTHLLILFNYLMTKRPSRGMVFEAGHTVPERGVLLDF